MNKELSNMSVEELIIWLESSLGSKWSNRDLNILANVLFDEYHLSKSFGEPCRVDREFFAKMLIKGKIQNGIPLED